MSRKRKKRGRGKGKKSLAAWKVLLLTFVASVLVVVVANLASDKEKKSLPILPVEVKPEIQYFPVPPFGSVHQYGFSVMDFKGYDPSHPPVTEGLVRESLRFILTMEDSRFLQSGRDKAIFRLAHRFHSGKEDFKIRIAAIKVPGLEGTGRMSEMAYSCTNNDFLVNPKISPTSVMLSFKLYHELDHAVRCREWMKEQRVTRHEDMFDYEYAFGSQDPCTREGQEGYAAQVRMYAALFDAKKFPIVLYNINGYELGRVVETNEVWKAILEGRFCAWYTKGSTD